MKINTKKSMVKPAKETVGEKSIQLSVLDRVYAFPWYNSTVHIYRPESHVDSWKLREALAETLVEFYPLAGRYRFDCDGAFQIDCNDAGVLYNEVCCDSTVEDLGELVPSPELSRLAPSIPYADSDISSYPLMMIQVTYFKCGGVSLGICMEHHTVDGASAFHVIRSWSEIARGVEISVPPFLDRTSVIHPREPPQPKFDHPEYPQQSVPAKKTPPPQPKHIQVSILKLSETQLAQLRAKTSYSRFELVAGHVWKCVTKVRNVAGEEETRLSFPVSARFNRLKPPLPRGFFGNAAVRPVAIARAADLESKPVWSYAAGKIRETLAMIDDEYVRSAIDHLALSPDISTAKYGPRVFDRPNFQITSWVGLGLDDADFGWGPPVYVGPGDISFEKAYIFPGSHGGGGVTVAVSLEADHLQVFENLFYDFV